MAPRPPGPRAAPRPGGGAARPPRAAGRLGALGRGPGDGRRAEYRDADIRILGFTDRHYIAIAKAWYMRLTSLVGGPRAPRPRLPDRARAFTRRASSSAQGYTEHYLVAYDE